MKIIKYDVDIKSTKINRTSATPRVYTNDLNSVKFEFNVLDMTTEELTGATATTLLYMRDGSFFQNASTDVDLLGNVFTYTLKENEGNHGGLAQIQLVVKIGTKEYATQLYIFEIVSGLETKVAAEVMIQDWTTLTRDARAYIDQFVADEAVRQQQFETAEANRVTFFETAETNRASAETNRVSAEQSRVTAETGRVNAETNRVSVEQGRVTAETGRVNAETIRAEFYEGFDGRLDDLESGRVVLKNLITNGDFSKGTTGWGSTSGVNIAVVDKVLTATVSLLAGSNAITHKTNSISSITDIHYLSFKFMPFRTHVPIIIGIKNLTTPKEALANTTNKISLLYTPTSADYTMSFRLNGANEADMQIGSVVEFSNFIDINLTAIFGAGNEPSKEWMDFLVSQTGYFEEYFLGDAWQVQELMRMDNVKANKQQEDWITPTLFEGTNGGLAYLKDEFGFVHFKGRVSFVGGVLTMFVMPPGYRPGIISDHIVFTSGDARRVRVNTNGNVDNSNLQTFVDFSNVIYKAER